MSAGRKTITHPLDPRLGKLPPKYRGLPESEFSGVIFGATEETIQECLNNLLFGLPENHICYVQHITDGMPLFLFNYSDRKLHGLFEADGDGDLNIDPEAWMTINKFGFPAQVKVRWRQRCIPIDESIFKPVIAENYYAPKHFMFELDRRQTKDLIQLFRVGMKPGISSHGSFQPHIPRNQMNVSNGHQPWTPRPQFPQYGPPSTSGTAFRAPSLHFSSDSAWQHRESGSHAEGIVTRSSRGSSHSTAKPGRAMEANESFGGFRSERIGRWGSNGGEKSWQRHPRADEALAEATSTVDMDQARLAAENQKLVSKLKKIDADLAAVMKVHLDLCAKTIQEAQKERLELRKVLQTMSAQSSQLKAVKPNASLEFRQAKLEQEVETMKNSLADVMKQLNEQRWKNGGMQERDVIEYGVAERVRGFPTLMEEEVATATEVIAEIRNGAGFIFEEDREAHHEENLEEEYEPVDEGGTVFVEFGATDVEEEVMEGQNEALLNVEGEAMEGQIEAFLNVEGEAMEGQNEALLNVEEEVMEGQNEALLNVEEAMEGQNESLLTVEEAVTGEELEVGSFRAGNVEEAEVSSEEKGDGYKEVQHETEQKARTEEEETENSVLAGEHVGKEVNADIFFEVAEETPEEDNEEEESPEADEGAEESQSESEKERDEAWMGQGDNEGQIRDENEETEGVMDGYEDEDEEEEDSYLPNLYMLGGCHGKEWTGIADVYSPDSDSWYPIAPLLSNRANSAAVAHNDRLYVFGGEVLETVYSTVESYDVEKGVWSSCSSLQLKRGNLAGESCLGHVYAMGGGTSSDYYAAVEWYDCSSDEWFPTVSMTEQRFGLSSVCLHDTIFVMGGFDGKSYLRSMERFDPREGSWAAVASMQHSRVGTSAAVLNEKLYVVGGFDGSNFLDTAEVYDPRADKWMDLPCPGRTHAYGGAATSGEWLYVIGGLDKGSNKVDSVLCYSEKSGWTSFPVSHATAKKRSFFSLVAY